MQTPKRQISLLQIFRYIFLNPVVSFSLVFIFVGASILAFTTNIISYTLFSINSIFLETEQVDAFVSDLTATNTSVNDRKIYKISFYYKYNGNYYINSFKALPDKYAPDTKFTITIFKNKPKTFIIGSTFTDNINQTDFILFIFPIMGGIVLLYTLKSSFTSLSIFRNGKIGKGKLAKVEKTNVSVNGLPIMKYTFDVTSSMGEKDTVVVKSPPLQTNEDNKLTDVVQKINIGKTTFINTSFMSNLDETWYENREFEIIHKNNNGIILGDSAYFRIENDRLIINQPLTFRQLIPFIVFLVFFFSILFSLFLSDFVFVYINQSFAN